jgi:hypothetical protein
MPKVQPSIICYYQAPKQGIIISPVEVFIDTDGNKHNAEIHSYIVGHKDDKNNIAFTNQQLKEIFPAYQLQDLSTVRKLTTKEYKATVNHTKKRVVQKWPNPHREVSVTTFPTNWETLAQNAPADLKR